MTPTRPRALLFDFDGVIADTENVHVAAWQRTFAAMGWEVPDDVCARSMEVDDRVFLADVFDRRKIFNGDVDGWVRRKQDLTLSLLNDSPRVYPGVLALIDRVSHLSTVALAVVSTTWRANVETVLTSSGVLSSFRLIVGKEDVKAAKPDPEGYKLAVARLGIRPEDAVALEDSATGLAAADGAGVGVVAVGHRNGDGPWYGFHEFLGDLRKTDEVLEKLGF